MCVDMTESQCVWNRRGKMKRYRKFCGSSKLSHYSLPSKPCDQAQLWDFCFYFYFYDFHSFILLYFLCNILRWGHVKVKEPWYDKCKHHASKQKVKEAVAVPDASSLSMAYCSWDWRCCIGIVHFIWELGSLNLSCSSNIACDRITNLTGPVRI